MFVWLFWAVFVPIVNLSLIWRRHHCGWRAANFDLCSALMFIEQWGFFSVPHQLWLDASVYNGHLRGPVTLTPIAELFAVELSLPVLTTYICRDLDFNTQPSTCEANALTTVPPPRSHDMIIPNRLSPFWVLNVFLIHLKFTYRLTTDGQRDDTRLLKLTWPFSLFELRTVFKSKLFFSQIEVNCFEMTYTVVGPTTRTLK